MNLKRIGCLFLTVLMLAGTLAACGGDPTESESDTMTAAPTESGEETGGESAVTPEDPGTEAVTPGTEGSEAPTEEPMTTEPESTKKEPDDGTGSPDSSAPATDPKTKEPPKTEEKDPYAQYREKDPVKNTAEQAPNEDASLRLWFDHSYNKTTQDVTASSGRNTYRIYMAKNEIEGCQFFLSSNTAKSGLSVEITPFENAAGKKLKTQLFVHYYFDVENKKMADPIVPAEAYGAVSIGGSASQGFQIKVTTTASDAAGDYTATLNVKNSAGQIVKTAKVYVRVWNFTLADESACKTAMDLASPYYVLAGYYNDNKDGIDWRSGDNNVTFMNYYNYLLENRISPYNLPYDGGNIFDPRNEEYMNNPRVTSFNILGWKSQKNYYHSASDVKAAYDKLSKNPEWLKKGYFYIVDEPTNMDAVNQITEIGKVLKENFPGYRLMAPFFINESVVINREKTDYIGVLADSITLWCPKPYCFVPYAEASAYKGLPVMMTRQQENSFGFFADRMRKEVEGGDELWWYECGDPKNPYITTTIEEPTVNCRILFWQQKQYNVTGFLYYTVNQWTNGDTWNSDKTTNGSGQTVYGAGNYIYCGYKYGLFEPVGSLRLEAIRDGIEDYEYLYMLEKKIGTEKTNALIATISRSVTDFSSDEELFNEMKIVLGNYLEAVS